LRWENKASLTAYFLSNISAENYQNRLMYIEVIASQSSAVFLDTLQTPWAIVRRFHDLKFSRFGTIPACERQTDRRTDRQTHNDSIYRASIASRGKKQQVVQEY